MKEQCMVMREQIISMQRWFATVSGEAKKDSDVQNAVKKLAQTRAALEKLTQRQRRTK